MPQTARLGGVEKFLSPNRLLKMYYLDLANTFMLEESAMAVQDSVIVQLSQCSALLVCLPLPTSHRVMTSSVFVPTFGVMVFRTF